MNQPSLEELREIVARKKDKVRERIKLFTEIIGYGHNRYDREVEEIREAIKLMQLSDEQMILLIAGFFTYAEDQYQEGLDECGD